MAKIDITKIDLTELISLEKAANIICKNYENLIKMYDGSINKNIKEYGIYTKYNNIRLKILDEIETRLNSIE
jgi:hypothetical protein